jgi:hypothetical protein
MANPDKVITRPGWRHEFTQHDGYYIVETWATGYGDHYEGSERVEGTIPEDKPKPPKPEPAPDVYVDSHQIHKDKMLNDIRYRDWYERNH